MRKVTTTVAAALVALSFAACNKTNNSVTPEEGSASGSYASLTVSTNALPSLKADPDPNQKDEGGRVAESKIETLDVLGTTPKAFTLSSTEDFTAAGKFWQDADDKTTYRTAPWQVRAGQQTLGVVLNKATITLPNPATFGVATFGSFTTAIKDIAALSTEDKFTMSSSSRKLTIKSGVTKEQASEKAGTETDNNVFAFDIERVVAQGYVGKGAELKSETTDGSGKVDLTRLTYSVMNGAAKTFIMRDNAGDRTMGDDKQYKGFKSAIDAYTFADAKAGTNVDENLIRIGRLAEKLGKTKNNELGGYMAISVNNDAYKTGSADNARGIYFLENSAAEELTPDNKLLGYARLATAKVYGTFAPNEVLTLKAGATVTFVAEDGCKVWYKVTTTEDKTDPKHTKTTVTYTDRTISDKAPKAPTTNTKPQVTITVEWKEGRAIYKLEDLEVSKKFTSGTTFYIGNKSGSAYDSIEAALAGNVNDKVFTYKDGRCGYYALWNRTPNKDIKNGEARRNNIYSLTIESFATRGFNFDPLDPKDPNLPQPDPTDPDNNKDPDHHTTDIEPAKGYMRVDCKVLSWNHVSRGVSLGEEF